MLKWLLKVGTGIFEGTIISSWGGSASYVLKNTLFKDVREAEKLNLMARKRIIREFIVRDAKGNGRDLTEEEVDEIMRQLTDEKISAIVRDELRKQHGMN